MAISMCVVGSADKTCFHIRTWSHIATYVVYALPEGYIRLKSDGAVQTTLFFSKCL